jgi:hypothetical protein
VQHEFAPCLHPPVPRHAGLPHTRLPARAPLAHTGIEQQIARLSEIEALQEEWQIQVSFAACAGPWGRAGAECGSCTSWLPAEHPCHCLCSSPQAEAQDEVERMLRSSAI